MSEPTGMSITIGGSLKHSDIGDFLEAFISSIYETNGPGPDSAEDFPESGKVSKNTWYGTTTGSAMISKPSVRNTVWLIDTIALVPMTLPHPLPTGSRG